MRRYMVIQVFRSLSKHVFEGLFFLPNDLLKRIERFFRAVLKFLLTIT